MTKAYSVFGDDEVELFDSDSFNECRSWAGRYTAKGWGGYDRLTFIDNATGQELGALESPDTDDDAAQYRPGGAFCEREDALDSDIGDHAFSGRISAGDY